MFVLINRPFRSVVGLHGLGLEGRREKPLLFYALTKENPAKGRVSRLLVGRVALFPLREEAFLTQQFCCAIGTVPLSANT